jgi:hypothetical protein
LDPSLIWRVNGAPAWAFVAPRCDQRLEIVRAVLLELQTLKLITMFPATATTRSAFIKLMWHVWNLTQ